MTDGRMANGHCVQCGRKRPDLGWYGVEYDDEFEKPIRFWCWPACMIKWNAENPQTTGEMMSPATLGGARE